jgi:hypothetical protein
LMLLCGASIDIAARHRHQGKPLDPNPWPAPALFV